MVVQFMTNSFENTLDIIVCLLFLYFFPLALINQHREVIISIEIEKNMSHFLDTVATKGYISKNLYEELNKNISGLAADSTIILEHEARIYYLDQQVSEGEYIYTNNINELYMNSYTDEILSQIYDENKLYYLNQGDYIRLRLERNEMYMSLRDGRIIRNSLGVRGDN